MANHDRSRIYDPLYGEVYLSAELSTLARTPAVQRLRHIRLSNIDSFNLPGIANISRFEHVIGAAILAGMSGVASRLSGQDRLTFQAAAMLHDAAIAPFGHLVEEALGYVDAEFDHETKWLRIIEAPGPSDLGGAEMPIFLGQVSGLRRWATSVFGAASADARLRQIFEASSGRGPWGKVIAGTLDIDNLDNLSRLAFHMGLDSQRDLPVRLAKALASLNDDGMPVFSVEAEADITMWSALRVLVYDRLMVGHDDLAAKIMLLSAVSEAYGTGDLEPNDYIWTLTDQQLIERLMASGQPSVRDPAEGWLVGHLWPLAEPLWLRGTPPQFRDLVYFNELVSEELGRHCFAYRIKDKRHRILRLPLTSGQLLSIGEDSDKWLLAIASRLAKSFTSADNRRIAQLACSHFGASIVAAGHTSMTGASLFDNAT